MQMKSEEWALLLPQAISKELRRDLSWVISMREHNDQLKRAPRELCIFCAYYIPPIVFPGIHHYGAGMGHWQLSLVHCTVGLAIDGWQSLIPRRIDVRTQYSAQIHLNPIKEQENIPRSKEDKDWMMQREIRIIQQKDDGCTPNKLHSSRCKGSPDPCNFRYRYPRNLQMQRILATWHPPDAC